ncbi:MAG: DUF2550 domain-containing protein [Micrococcales bacterium]|nr:DUF2550 domain-containing protein [Micrococcales bacterium]
MAGTRLVVLLLAAVALGAVLAVGVVWLRRMSLLGHRPGTFRCWVGASTAGPWRPGLAEYSEDRLSWWPRFSLGGAERWQRSCLEVASRVQSSSLGAGGEPMLVLSCSMTRPDEAPENLYLLVEDAASAGLTSWLEATPRPPQHLI